MAHLESPGAGLKLHHAAIEHHVQHEPREETHQGQVLRKRKGAGLLDWVQLILVFLIAYAYVHG